MERRDMDKDPLSEWILTVGGILILVVPPSLAMFYDWPWWAHVICWWPLACVIGAGLALSFRWPWP